MGKIIFWVVVFFVILFALRLVNSAKTSARRNDRSPPPAPDAGAMTRCVACGVYLPSAEAKAGPQGPLCGDPHCLERAGDKRR